MAERLVATLPDVPSVLNNLAVELRRRGQLIWAAAILQRLVQSHPDDAAALNNLGHVLTQRRCLPDAVVALRRSLAVRPAHASTLNNLGHALWLSGDSTQAIEALRESLKIRPGQPAALLNLAMALFKRVDVLSAMETLKKIPPDEPQYAMAALASGDTAEANRLITVALAISPMGTLRELRDDLEVLAAAGIRGAEECISLVDEKMQSRESHDLTEEELREFIEAYLVRHQPVCI